MNQNTKRDRSLRQRGSFAYRHARLRLRPLIQWIRWVPLERQVAAPVFIFGSTRSGKTILKTLLGNHPEIAAFPTEANHLWHPATHPWQYSQHRATLPPYWAGPALHTEKSLKLRSPRHSNHIRTVFGAFAWRRKRPILLAESAKITFMVPYILEVFPDARFIHLLRHGRCVAFLQGKKIAAAVRSNYQLYAEAGFALSDEDIHARCATSWTEHVREAHRLASDTSLMPRPRVLEVRYEHLCEEPLFELERIRDFLDLPRYSEIASDVTRTIANHNPTVEAQISDDERSALNDVLGATLSSLGYD